MKFVSNIELDSEIIDFVLNNPGTRKPELPVKDFQNENYQRWVNSGYDLRKIGWNFFTGSDLPRPFKLPFEGNVSWWFSKLNPGDLFPMHVDSYSESKTIKRYWVACKDYEPGHIFVYGDKVLTDYKKGDMYEFTDNNILHAAVNVGFTPKVTLQISIEV